MTYIALFRGGRDLRQYRMVEESNVDKLFTFAHTGDTLHRIPEEFTHKAADVLGIVQEQLALGPEHYVKI